MFRQFTHSLSFSFRAHRYRAYLSLAKRGRKKSQIVQLVDCYCQSTRPFFALAASDRCLLSQKLDQTHKWHIDRCDDLNNQFQCYAQLIPSVKWNGRNEVEQSQCSCVIPHSFASGFFQFNFIAPATFTALSRGALISDSTTCSLLCPTNF